MKDSCPICRANWGATESECGHAVCDDCRVGTRCVACYFERAEPNYPVVILTRDTRAWIVHFEENGEHKEEIRPNAREAYLLAVEKLTGKRFAVWQEALDLVEATLKVTPDEAIAKLLAEMKYMALSQVAIEVKETADRAASVVARIAG